VARWAVASLVISGTLFLVAGRTDLPRLWLFAGLMSAMLLAGLVFIPAEVVAERLKKHQTADPVVLALVRILFLATFVLGAADVGRLHRSDTVPMTVSVAALLVAALALGFAFSAIRVNRFFMPAVRIQSERGHRVVDTGPYRLVRHPGYVAMLFLGPASALAMGSWLALVPGIACGLTFVFRAHGEDRFLLEHLDGYREYATRTRYRMIPGLWCLLLCAIAIPARAQDTTAAPPRPFTEGGQYDRPYLARLAGRTAIGGYAEAHARLARVDGVTDEFGFQALRFNLFTATQVSDIVRIGAEIEFEDGGREIKLEYAAIDVAIHPVLTLRAGMLLVPLGRFNLAHDSPRNEFSDRPLVSTDLLGVALSEPGLGAFGLFGLRGAGRVTYEVYAVNGFHDGLIDQSPDGTRIPLGRGNFEDNNNSPSFAGRVAWSPRVGLEFGLSAHVGAYNVFTVDGNAVDERRDVSIGALDAEAEVLGVKLMGEMALVNVDVAPGLMGVYASRQRGVYLQAVRPFGRGLVPTMPNSFFAAGLRLDAVDFDTGIAGDSRVQATLGVNFRPTTDTAIKLDWVRGRDRDRFNTPSERSAFQVSVATYF
jgi:protein-S-isoprenylcysteine O-methyltransferase Ste14